MRAIAERVPLRQLGRHYFLFSLLLLVVVVAINFAMQPAFFRPLSLYGMLRTFLPLMLVSIGQAIVIIGGGIDLSVAAVVSMVNVILVTRMSVESGPSEVGAAIALGMLAALGAGLVNGICVGFLRFQPLVTTFATTSIFTGVAIWVLPRPGGAVPEFLMGPLREMPLGIGAPLWIIVAVLLIWAYVRSTRYGRFLYASGGQPVSAYMSAVPVDWIRFSTYVIAGLMAGLAGVAQTMDFGTGSPLVSAEMALNSIVAVVLGGTPLSGGAGGVGGTVVGVLILIMIQNIISFANVDRWYQTLVKGLIVVAALAGPGVVGLLRRK